MSNVEEKNKLKDLLKNNTNEAPAVGDIVRGTVISATKSEVKLDIDGYLIGVVRGPELYEELDEYSNLQAGDKVDATVIDEENENYEIELSFKHAGQEKSIKALRSAFVEKTNITVKVVDANKGGLLVQFKQIPGFLPVSQLSPENYPRVSGGDQGKILEKLRKFIGTKTEVKVITLEEDSDDKIIFSEKDVWSEKQKDVIDKYKVNTIVNGKVTAVTNFGIFINFDEKMEGLIHISELAWQRIDNPSNFFKVGDEVKAQVIEVNGSKIFLSIKRLEKDPWSDVDKKYKVGQIVNGKILKINPFGLFVRLDDVIHGLAHISQIKLNKGESLRDIYKVGEKYDFEITSLNPAEYRLGLKFVTKDKSQVKEK